MEVQDEICAQPHGLSAYRRAADGALCLAVCPQERREVYPAH